MRRTHPQAGSRAPGTARRGLAARPWPIPSRPTAVTVRNGNFRHKFFMQSSILAQVARAAPAIGRYGYPTVC
jgi:hypothetical protein